MFVLNCDIVIRHDSGPVIAVKLDLCIRRADRMRLQAVSILLPVYALHIAVRFIGA